MQINQKIYKSKSKNMYYHIQKDNCLYTLLLLNYIVIVSRDMIRKT